MLSLTLKPRAKQEIPPKDLEAEGDIADDVIESDFVPYACLFDPSTIATKDAELLQTIKITGLGYEGQTQGNLRDAIRATIRKAIPDDRFAIWLHTYRKRQASSARTHYPDAFSGKIDETWRGAHTGASTYSNELYVSIVMASAPSDLKNKNVLKQSFFPKRDSEQRSKAMLENLGELSRVTQRMITLLQPFGARLLTTVERDGIFYSEQLEFLEKLINLEERPMALPERDLSHTLTSGEITFGFNAMEVRTAEGVRRFAAILTLKEYKESTLKGIDQFLDIPCELIVSQCFDFTGAAQAQEAYQKQARYLMYSGDRELGSWMEIDRLMNSQENLSNGFGQQQTTIFLIAPSVNQLEGHVRMVQRALNRLGLIVVREDLRFEECYWSQLPANFTFITRKQAIDTDHIAGFVNLQAAPMGNANGSPWGAPISLFETLQDRPYYFNFHRGNSAHTLLLGKPGSGLTTFTHFLLAQTRKLPVALWYLDTSGRGKALMEAMGGQYYTPGTNDCAMNPLQLPESQANREFLALWLSTLIDPTGYKLNHATLSYLQSIISQVQQLPRASRRMSAVVDLVRRDDSLLAGSLQRYVAGSALGALFDAPEDRFTVSKLCGWQLHDWMKDPATRIPLTGYLLHRLTGLLNGSPTLLVLNEGFDILDTPLFSARVLAWYDYLTQNNAATLLTTSDVENAALRPYAPAVASRTATIFAMPNQTPEAGYSMGFGFSPEEVASLTALNKSDHHILQKRGAEAVVIRASLEGLPATSLATLRGKPPTTQSAADMLAELMGQPLKAG